MPAKETKQTESEYKGSIFRLSAYVPLNQHQFREREKSKEIKPKPSQNELLYKRLKEERKARHKHPQEPSKSKIGVAHTFRKGHPDNYSDAHSFYDDNISLRYSINSEVENIER